MPVDEEFEKLKDKSNLRLNVLNTATQEVEPFTLEGDGTQPPDGSVDFEQVEREVIAALRTVHDPEIPLNIYDLGLIYAHDVSDDGSVSIKMTLTAPGCPVAGTLVGEVHESVRRVRDVRHVKTELVWDPPWDRERMSEEARLELGLL